MRSRPRFLPLLLAAIVPPPAGGEALVARAWLRGAGEGSATVFFLPVATAPGAVADVVTIHAAADHAIRRARSGGGPSLLECKTYRTRPHAEGMGDFSYRTREEVDHWKTLDPIPRLKQHLLAHQMATEADFAVIEADVAALVAESQQFAESSPWPEPSSAEPDRDDTRILLAAGDPASKADRSSGG